MSHDVLPAHFVSTPTEPIALSADLPFYVSRDSETYGPYAMGDLATMLGESTVTPDDLIWVEGWPEWRAVQDAFEIEPVDAPASEEPELRPNVPIAPAAAFLSPAPARKTRRRVQRQAWQEVSVAKDSTAGNQRRLGYGVLAAVLAHASLLFLAMWLATEIFRVTPFPAIPAAAAPPPLEVEMIPEEEPAPTPPPPVPPPPTPPPPQPVTPPPDLQPPPPPAPPIIPLQTAPPPPPVEAPPMPTPPPLVVPAVPSQPAPAHPHHVAAHRTTPSPAPPSDVPSAPTVANAGPSDYLYAPKPDYPFTERQRHHAGTVLLRVTVSAQGIPSDVQIQRSCGYSVLDASALRTVRDEYRFKVGTSRILIVPISFRGM